jgi:hypothetical protein
VHVGDDTRWGGMVFSVPFNCSEHRASSPENEGRSSTVAGNVPTRSVVSKTRISPRYPRWSDAMVASAGGTGGKTHNPARTVRHLGLAGTVTAALPSGATGPVPMPRAVSVRPADVLRDALKASGYMRRRSLQ